MNAESELKYVSVSCINLDIGLVLPMWIKRAWKSLHFHKHFLSLNNDVLSKLLYCLLNKLYENVPIDIGGYR